MREVIKALCLIVSILFLSCGKEKTTGQKDDSQIRYKYFNLEKNGWKSRTTTQFAEGINFSATEVPLQYYILKDLGTENLFTADSVYEKNKHERIIEFEFMHQEQRDLLDKEFTGLNYEDAVKYVSFNMEKDFYVVTPKNDTIQCSGVSFERNFKVAPYQRVLLFFTGIVPEDKIQLVYNDHLFKKGTMKFKFEEKITKLIL